MIKEKNEIIDLGNIGIRQVQISTLARALGYKKGKDVNYKYKKTEAVKMLKYMVDKKHKGYESAQSYLASINTQKKVSTRRVVKEGAPKAEDSNTELLRKMLGKIERLEKDLDYLKRLARCR